MPGGENLDRGDLMSMRGKALFWVLEYFNYEGCVGGIVNCCEGVQAQLDEAIDETHKEAGVDGVP